MQAIPFSEARAHLAQTIQAVEDNGQPVFISQRGKTTAVLMSIDTYQQLTGVEQGFSERLAVWRQTHLAELALDDEFSVLRPTTAGRDFSW